MEKIMELLFSLDNIEIFRWGLPITLSLLIIFDLFLLIRFFICKYCRKSLTENQNKKRFILHRLEFFLTLGGAILVNGILLIAVIGFSAFLTIPQPKVILPNSPSLEAIEITPEKPFVIVFDRPIDSDSIEKSITPELKGNWKSVSRSYLFLADTLIFIPEESPSPEARYTISLKNIRNLLDRQGEEYLLSFMAPPLPAIISIDPVNGTEGVLPSQKIRIETDYAHQNSASFDFRFAPEVETTIVQENATKYNLQAKNGFKKSTTYTLDIYRTPIVRNFNTDETKEIGEAILVSQSNFRTMEAPGVADYGPKGAGIMVDSAIWIEFKQNMDATNTEKALTVTPAIEGTKTWETPRKFAWKPTALAKNTTYTVVLSKEAKVADGSNFEEPFAFSFVTIGHVRVNSFYPANNSAGIGLDTKISVYFNQAVDHGSAQSHFVITPNVSGTFGWSGNTMVFTHSSFAYSTRYTVNVSAGIKTIYGLDSVQDFITSFTTRDQSIVLNVPSYRQVHMYSCMAAAARSALAYRGAYVSEDQLLYLMGYDYTAFSGTWGDPSAVWGNPYQAIVGNIDGKSGGVTWGYGAYWGPTSKAISNYRGNEIKTGWNVNSLAEELTKGNPVIIWWVNGVWPAYEVYWKTTSGESIRGVNSMHVQVVKGFTGTVNNPKTFTVTDSGYGYPTRTYDVNTFKAKWSWFGNTAIVVR